MAEFLRLKKSNCQNCYKCIRNCPVKSIKFSGGQANIIGNECILCGQCFVVCPQHAKEIVSSVETVKVLISEATPVVASVAPSFIANYRESDIETIEEALKKLGFFAAEETAIGATSVKNEYNNMLAEKKKDILISSCCHSVNLLIQKYFPSELEYLADIVSPMQAHCIDIKKRYPGCKTVFIGPCVSKKDEADYYGDIVDEVLTFEELTEWLAEENIEVKKSENLHNSNNAEGLTRLFPTTGGILKSMGCDNKNYSYMAIDGVENCIEVLKDIENGDIHNCFIEMSACVGSCIGGPAMDVACRAPVRDYISVSKYAGQADFTVNPLSESEMKKNLESIEKKLKSPTEKEISDTLRQMGKTTPADELNCGSCGYNSCREKAVAVLQGKAEISMCLPFLMRKAESFSGKIINNTPNAIIVLNEDLEVQQINKSALKLMNIRSSSDVMGEQIIRVLDPKDFMQVRKTGVSVNDKRLYLAEYKKYVEETIIYDREYKILICIMRDVTDEELQRERKEKISSDTIDITDKVVEKQMRVVQEIASLLGETAAETKIALTKLKESIKDE